MQISVEVFFHFSYLAVFITLQYFATSMSLFLHKISCIEEPPHQHVIISYFFSETMSVPMFHYVQQQMEKYYDMISVEKKKFAPWVRRLNLALRAYKELLNTLLAMDTCPDSTVKDSAKVLKSNIFYVLEYREFVLNTFLNYDDNKMPR